MKALILAGGLGTRLRPLTYTIPKPLVPLLGKPLVGHIIDSLPPQVDSVVLAVSYMKDVLEGYFREHDPGREVILVNEDRPLGTGGAIKNVSRYLDGTFIAFNGDVVCSLDLEAMLRYHRSHGGIGTLSLWPVEDPTAFGVVALSGQRIMKFQEKPKREEAASDLINAGVYVFEQEILDHIPSGVVSLERQVFPYILDQGLNGYRFDGYWIDCGTRENFLKAQRTLLDRRKYESCFRSEGRTEINPPSFINGAILRSGKVGPYAYIEEGAILGSGCLVTDSMVMSGAEVGEGATVRGSIIGPGCRIPAGRSVENDILAGG